MGSRNSRHSDTRLPRGPRERRAPYRLPAQDAVDAQARRSMSSSGGDYEVIRTSSDVTAESGQSITVDSTSGDIEVDLTSSPVPGRPIAVKKSVAANNVNINGTVEGAAKIVMTAQYEYRILMYDGDAWYIIGQS